MEEITTAEAVEMMVKLIATVERRQERDEAKNPDAGIFWEGYQAALYDLLHEIDPGGAGTETTRRLNDLVCIDVARWETLPDVDEYARLSRVSRAQAIKWLVNMAVAHPTRLSCHEGECDWRGCGRRRAS